MTRQHLQAIVAGVAVAVLLASVTTSGDTPLFAEYPSISLERWQLEAPPGADFGLDADLPEEETEVFKIWEVDLPDALAVALQILVVAAAVALLIKMWQSRPRLRWRRASAPDDFDVLEDLARSVSADAAAQRSALAAGTPRNAIVACWLRLERVTEDAGLDRNPADTSEEFTSRVLTQFSVDPAAVHRLAGSYRRARFSSHPMGEDDRAEAMGALDAIHAGLEHSVAGATA